MPRGEVFVLKYVRMKTRRKLSLAIIGEGSSDKVVLLGIAFPDISLPFSGEREESPEGTEERGRAQRKKKGPLERNRLGP